MQNRILGTAILLASASFAVAQSPAPLLTPAEAISPAVTAWNDAELARQPAFTTARFVRVASGVLAPGAVVGIDVNGEALTLEVSRQQRSLRHELFFGEVRGRESQVVLAVGAAGVIAASITVDDSTWSLDYTGHGDLHVLRSFDQTVHSRAHGGCGLGPSHVVHTAPTREGQRPPAAERDGPTSTIVDVMAFYTPAARQSAGGTAAIEAAIAMRIGTATAGCVTSGVDHEYRLVYMAQTNYTELGSSTDLYRFRISGDGHMDEVHALRTTYGGDLMALITNQASFCGIAYLMANPSTAFASRAFSVTVRSCMSGHTLTHEMGHNMGCHHDRANAQSQPAYPFSYGYRTSTNRYRTIMAYRPGSRVNKWSSPYLTQGGLPLGTPNDDNARSLNQAKSIIRGFHATRVLEWCPLAGGISGTGGKPTVRGEGTINNAVPIRVIIGNTLAGAPGALAIGFAEQNVPFFGGTLVPTIAFTIGIVGTGGDVRIDASALSTLPSGSSVWFQAGFLDRGAPLGLSASDALKVEVP